MIVYKDYKDALLSIVDTSKYDKVFCLIDYNVESFHNVSKELSFVTKTNTMIIDANETVKDKKLLFDILQFLYDQQATRSSLMLVFGGGVLTDIGGFAASIYKRGIDFINIPTTLMGMVDAAIGGKNAINFENSKNVIGTFRLPLSVVIDTVFLSSLSNEDILSGFGEVIKYGLLIGGDLWQKILSIGNVCTYSNWSEVVRHCADYKEQIVSEDFFDNGLRKTLNLGHTIGHAIESTVNRKEKCISHGHAVVIGLVIELYLSNKLIKSDSKLIKDIIDLVKQNYPPFSISCKDYPLIMQHLKQDKKNKGEKISFVLLQALSEVQLLDIDDERFILSGLDFYQDMFGF